MASELNSASLRSALKTLGSQWPVHFFAQTASTQREALRLAKDGAPHGSLVVAAQQLAGRGRQGKSWWHDAQHGLAASWILRPNLSPRQAPGLVFAAALALHEVFSTLGLSPLIKWPNDVVFGRGRQRRKVAGILSQAASRAGTLNFAVVGIGINVNTAALDFPKDAGAATSLLVERGKSVDRVQLLAQLCVALDKKLDVLERQGLATLLDDLRGCSETLGQELNFVHQGQARQGLAEDFSEDGALLLRLDDGNLLQLTEPFDAD